jgi:D-3-phosphoglycerate dehydrogenase
MKIVVTSPSFSTNETLAAEIRQLFPDVCLNTSGMRLEGDELAHFIRDAEGVVVGLEKFDARLLGGCPNLKIVAKYGVGLDNIDLDACGERGIAIGWTGGVNRLSVAEMTLGFMLALCRNLFRTSLDLKGGTWAKNGGSQLTGKSIGIIGAGNIGREVIRLLQPFGCRILVNDIADISGYCRENGLQEASKDKIYEECDIVSLHVPATAETRFMVDLPVFERMKPTAFLVNTSRGTVVRQEALKKALASGVIAGAALDVYEEEPPTDLELLHLPNLICTPHIGGNSTEAVLAMGRSAIHHLARFFGITKEET